MIVGIDTRAASWYRGTGIGTYSYELIKSLLNIDKLNKYNLYIPNNSYLSLNSSKNVKEISLKQKRKDNFWFSVDMTSYSLNDNEDIYHVPQNGIGLPKKKYCKYVITLHDIIPVKMPETVSNEYLKLFHSKMPDILANCDGIITVSEFSKKDIVECFNFPSEKVHVTHLASKPIYKPINKQLSKLIIKRFYGIEGNLILYIGGFSPRKNILNLINSFSKLHNMYKDYTLVIAGTKGLSYSIYKKRVEELNLGDSVLFPGYIEIDHLPYLYNASDLFVYPSFYEGFGLPPIEAMACGIPVIASNVTSIPEIVKDAASFVDPYDVDDMFVKMKEALINENLKDELIDKGFKRSSELSWYNTAKSTLDAYEKIVKV